MDRTNFTPANIEARLRALRSGRVPAPGTEPITWIDPATGEESQLPLEEILHKLSWHAYARLRQDEGLDGARPVRRQDALAKISEDFRTPNRELTAWSALYYRYLSGISIQVEELSRAAGVVPQQFRRRVNQGLVLLARALEAHSRVSEQAGVHSSLPPLPLPDFTGLVGVQAYFERLSLLVGAPDGAGLVSLEGMGGIGKSALARAFVSLPETMQRWSRIVWVSARQSILLEDGGLSPVDDSVITLEDITARLCEQIGYPGLAAQPLHKRLEGLKSALAQAEHLIIVDNLETVEEYRQLVPALGMIVGTSRFLITTRQTLREFPFVHTIPLAELDRHSAHELIEAEIARRILDNRISPEQFEELYQVVGGLPLALKLVAAQLYLRPLSEILAGFREARVGAENLYRYLYWQTWQSLRDPARQLLLSFLPSDPEGEDLEFLRIMSGQEQGEFYQALKELDQFSLLELNGDAERPLYRLHRLTTTFLQTDVLNLWDND